MINLTSAERKTLFFTIAVLIVSGVYQWIQPNNASRKTWDYSESDSTFNRLSKVETSPQANSNKIIETDSTSEKKLGSAKTYRKKIKSRKKKETEKLLPGSININVASAAELQKLPRIGAVIADRIIEYRINYGEFKTIEELLKVKGVGKKTLEKLLPYITVK